VARAGALAGLAAAVPALALAAEPPAPLPAAAQSARPPAPIAPAPDKPLVVNLMGRFGVALPPEAAARIQTLDLAHGHTLGLEGLTLNTGPAEVNFPPPAPPGSPDGVSHPSRRPWAVMAVGNTGGEEARPWRASATIGLPSLTHAEELTRLELFHGLVNGNQAGAVLSSTFLVTPHGLGVHADLAAVHINPLDRALDANTVVNVGIARAELDQAVLARGAQFAGLRLGLEAVEMREDFVIGGAPDVRDHVRNLFAGATVRLRHGEAYAEGDLQLLKGLSVLGASRPGQPLLSHSDADPQAFFVRGAAKFGRPLLGGVVEARLRGQWTDRPLPIFDNFIYQGFETARSVDPEALRTDHALDPRVLRGDVGAAAGLEYSFNGPQILGASLRPFAFVEHAEIRNLGIHGAPHGAATLAGGGLRLSTPRRLAAELMVEAPTGPIQGLFSIDTAKPRLLFTLARTFGG
jgi:hemolysin activation/secretion protein